MSESRKLSRLSIISLCVLVGLLLFGGYQVVTAKQQIGDDEFGSRVRAYLMSNPQVLREVINELSAQEKMAAAADQKSLLTVHAKALKHDPASYVAGNPDGDITIVEFFDYRCGYCKKSYPDVMKTVADDGNIRLVLKEFPILGEQSILATQAAIASIEQGKYIEFHDALMAARGSFSKEVILGIASDVGLDIDKLQEDMQKDSVRKIVEDNYALAKQLGINGTPAFIIGEHFVPGVLSIEQMKQLIASARESAAAADSNADNDSKS
ncbi:DsbA family protein [Sneathiella sp.]|uniref:DsbA family protein n=1 Tax=Sneathiella sp. TaxID=1964365 RepID=UPI0035667FD1